jgi:hypothetical protein
VASQGFLLVFRSCSQSRRSGRYEVTTRTLSPATSYIRGWGYLWTLAQGSGKRLAPWSRWAPGVVCCPHECRGSPGRSAAGGWLDVAAIAAIQERHAPLAEAPADAG